MHKRYIRFGTKEAGAANPKGVDLGPASTVQNLRTNF